MYIHQKKQSFIIKKEVPFVVIPIMIFVYVSNKQYLETSSVYTNDIAIAVNIMYLCSL